MFAEVAQDPAALGRALLLAVGAAVAISAPMLGADAHGWATLAAVSAAMLVVLAASTVVHWAALPQRATLFFPAAVCVAMLVANAMSPGLVAPLSGLLTLGFAYVGLTQRPGTGLWGLPLAAVTFVVLNGGPSQAIFVRLIMAVAVWTMLAELLSRFAARQSELNAALRRAAHVDVLTGLANRRDLQTQLPLAAVGDAVVVCDLDHFKTLNDTHGHHAGDVVLADFGALLRAELRTKDYCARYGGEEFVLLLPRTGAAEAIELLRRLRKSWSMMQPDVTFSAGVAACRPDRSATASLAAADEALYAAKRAGRNTDRAEAPLSVPTD